MFVPVARPMIIGDLFPSVVGLGVGIALLFEALRQEVFSSGSDPSGDSSPRDERAWQAPRAYRIALAAFAFAAAILHFFLPERLFL